MDKKILVAMCKDGYTWLVNYFKTELAQKLVEALRKAWQSFVETLWDELKDEIKAQVSSAVQFIVYYFDTEDAKEREEMIIDVLVKNIELPVLLKPFRGLIKKILKSKLEDLVRRALKKLDKFA